MLFSWSSNTKPCFINFFNQLKEATKLLLGVPPRSLFFSLTPESESSKVMWQKPMRCSLISFKQVNYHNNTNQVRFLVGRRNFTVLYKNPKRGDRQITQIIKPIQSSERSLQLKWGILSVHFNLCNNMMIHLAALGLLRKLDRRRRSVAMRLRTSCWTCLTNSLGYS